MSDQIHTSERLRRLFESLLTRKFEEQEEEEEVGGRSSLAKEFKGPFSTTGDHENGFTNKVVTVEFRLIGT